MIIKLIKETLTIIGIVLMHVIPVAIIFSFVIFVAIKFDDYEENRLYDIAVSMKPDNSEFVGRVKLYDLVDRFENEDVCLLSIPEIKNKKPSSIWRWSGMKYWLETNHTENKHYYVFTRPIKESP